MKTKYIFTPILFLILLTTVGSSDNSQIFAQRKSYQLSIIHMNDIHSHLEQEQIKLTFNKLKVKAEVGGMPRAIEKIESLKKQNPQSLVLNAGDTFQGTLYYSLFKGKADADMLNLVAWDAIVPGNHEFDDGDAYLAKYIDKIKSPFVAANVVPEPQNILAGKWQPYLIKNVNGEKIAIVGIDITDKTRDSSNPSKEIKFYNEVKTAQKYIDELSAQGINKIILLSHVGLQNDIRYAHQLKNVDVIVGGDSHSLMGSFKKFALSADSKKYPLTTTSADGKKVCIAQAWNYSYVVGNLNISFDAQGNVQSCKGKATLLLGDTFVKGKDKNLLYVNEEELAKIKKIIAADPWLEQVRQNPQALAVLTSYKQQVEQKKNEVLGKSAKFLGHTRVPQKSYNGVASQALGSEVAPIICKSFYEFSKRSSLCIQNAGGVRESIRQGAISMGDAYAMLPFSNTLFEIEMTGAEIKQVLEDALSNIYDMQGSDGSFPYAYALRYDIDITRGKDKRVSGLEIRDRKSGTWQKLQEQKNYVVVTNSYTAAGKDGYTTFKNVQDKHGKGVDTYLDYALSYARYVQSLNAQGKKVTKLSAAEHPIKSFSQ